MTTNGGTPTSDASSITTSYKNAVNAFVTAQQNSVQTALSSYNSSNASSTTSIATSSQQYGWIYAPVWLVNIVNSNSMIVNSFGNLGNVTLPSSPQFNNGGNTDADQAKTTDAKGNVTSDYSAAAQWGMVQQIFNSSIPENVNAAPSGQTVAQQGIQAQLQSLTSAASLNPLAMAGTVGHSLMTSGFAAITPQNIVNCLEGQASTTTGDPKQSVSCSEINGSGGLTNGQTTLYAGHDLFPDVNQNVRPLLYPENSRQRRHCGVPLPAPAAFRLRAHQAAAQSP